MPQILPPYWHVTLLFCWLVLTVILLAKTCSVAQTLDPEMLSCQPGSLLSAAWDWP